MNDELKKCFIPTGERTKHRISIWKCVVEDCEKTMESGDRIRHLRHNHLTTFQQIDNKLPIKDVSQKRMSGSKFKCIMCGEEFNSDSNFSNHRGFKILNIFKIMQSFISFQSNYGGKLGCPQRDNFFSGPFRTWKRWGELYNERRKRPSTAEERGQRLKKMIVKFENEVNSSGAELYSVYIKQHPHCLNPIDAFKRGGLSRNIQKRVKDHRIAEAQFMPLDSDYERDGFLIYQLVTDVPEKMARLIEEKLNSSKDHLQKDMRNLQIPFPQPLPDDRPEVVWREEVIELFLDAVEAKIPAVFTNTPKVIFYFQFSKCFQRVKQRVQLQRTPRTSTETESQTDEDIWKTRAINERKRKWEISKEKDARIKRLEDENKELKEKFKKSEEENRRLKGEEKDYVNETEEEISDNEALNETRWSNLSISPKY
uniref:C2H2-type domain-containing protein n=1 Tax=Meloidogyne hapla TaxID=6305 RepID=A0A1I8B3D4_MELHA